MLTGKELRELKDREQRLDDRIKNAVETARKNDRTSGIDPLAGILNRQKIPGRRTRSCGAGE